MADPSKRRVSPVVLVLLAVTALAAGVPRIPETLARVEAFRVRTVIVEGDRFLPREQVVALAHIPVGASVWDDFDPWERRLRAHPLVAEAHVDRRLPDTLLLRLREREPVAYLPAPILKIVDVDGTTLPLDPAVHALDLPLLGERAPVEGVAPSRLRVRGLAEEVARLRSADPEFLAGLSELAWDGRGGMVALWGDAVVPVRFHPPLGPRRVREALQVLADASDRFRGRRYEVDLRWDDQVVVRLQDS